MPRYMGAEDLPTMWQIQQALEPFREIRQCTVFEMMLMWTAPKDLREFLGETPYVLHDGGQIWDGFDLGFFPVDWSGWQVSN
jgi:hypothetical protein